MLGSLTNELYPTGRLVIPEVGMGATHCSWSDRHPYTVVRVGPKGADGSVKTCWVQSDNAKRTDDNGMSESQTYEFSPNPDGEVKMLRLTKRGWACKGEKFSMGQRSSYHDYSF